MKKQQPPIKLTESEESDLARACQLADRTKTNYMYRAVMEQVKKDLSHQSTDVN